MNNKQRTKMLAKYCLSQLPHKELMLKNILYYMSDKGFTSRKRLREYIQESTWYHAMIVLYGRAEARKELTELLREVK